MRPALQLLHLKVSPGSEAEFVDAIAAAIAGGGKTYGIALNLTKYVVSKSDAKLRETIASADLVIADGVPIVWMARRLGHGDVVRVTGVELAERLIRESGSKNMTVFILGAAPAIVNEAVKNLRGRYPDCRISGFHDGYFKPEDVAAVIERINRVGPDILLLGMGMPQKEYFVHDHLSQLDVHFCLPVGGAIDVWAGAKKRTPAWLQQIGMEWLYRSFYDFSRAGNIIRYGLAFLKDYVWLKN